MASLAPDPAAPAAGQTGHFAHHTWLFNSVKAINTELEATLSESDTVIDVSDLSTVAKLGTALTALVTALDAAGIITKDE